MDNIDKKIHEREYADLIPAKDVVDRLLSSAAVNRGFKTACRISLLMTIMSFLLGLLFSKKEGLAMVFAWCFGISLLICFFTSSLMKRYSVKIGLSFYNVWTRMEKRWPTLFEFIKYWLVANVTTIIDYAITFIMLWVVFAKLQYREFGWTIGNFTVFHYDAGEGMGLAGFLAYVISYVISQIFSFFAQRKYAFKSNNDVVVSAVWFAVVTLIVLAITQFLPQFYMNWLYGLVGSKLGSVLIKFFNCCVGLWLMYPINKYIIMRRDNNDETLEQNNRK